MSHMAQASAIDERYTQQQAAYFYACIESWGGRASLANSATYLTHRDLAQERMRICLALYGVNPAPQRQALSWLRPAMSLYSQLIAIKPVKQGACIGYDSRYVCPTDMTIGILNIGYAHGYPQTVADGTADCYSRFALSYHWQGFNGLNCG